MAQGTAATVGDNDDQVTVVKSTLGPRTETRPRHEEIQLHTQCKDLVETWEQASAN